MADYCRQCGICQKTSPTKPCRAPLIPLPIVDEPFQKVALDIVRPLPRSGSGNVCVGDLRLCHKVPGGDAHEGN